MRCQSVAITSKSWTMIAGSLVVFMQAGFALVESGRAPLPWAEVAASGVVFPGAATAATSA
jgi:hypothetical protein